MKKLLFLSVLTLATFVGGLVYSTVEAAAPPTTEQSEVAKKGKKGRKGGKGKKGKKGRKGGKGKKTSFEAPSSALGA